MVEKVSLPKAQYVEIRLPSQDKRGKILARYDPVRGILELQSDRVKYYFDLTLVPIKAIAESAPQREEPPEF